MLGIAILAVLAAAAWGEDPTLRWPAFLPPPDTLPAQLAVALERTWTERTFSRTVRGPSTRAPFDLYAALVDAPDVTAAAARHRHFAADEVRLVGDNLYEADDHGGSRGFYRVLTRERYRRVIYSWGENSGSVLGTIRGDALTVLTLEPRDGSVEQALTAHVRIDNRVVATLARALIVLFGGIADRRLGESFAAATQVANWAVAEPRGFCAWLTRSELPPERRAPIERLLPRCA